MRHRPDGPVLVRTYPVTFLHPHTLAPHVHDWDQLTYAASGVMRVDTAEATWTVPPHCAVWVPAGVSHAEQMHAPVSVRTLYFAPRLARALPRDCRTLNISSLMRELILHVSRRGALDRRDRADANLIGVLVQQLSDLTAIPLQLLLPRDARAMRFAHEVQHRPQDGSSIGTLARRAGASRRTIERLFLAETGMRVGDWRRRARLLHAVRRLAERESVGNVASEAGYASVSAFVAVFRKTFGTTPGRYA
jgi:AraC-like DNA-binding protein